MTEAQHKAMRGTYGTYTGSTAEGICARGSDGERIVAYWKRPRCASAPEIVSMERAGSVYILKTSDGCKFFLLA